MDVRLVAYRRETTASGTYDVKNYELDLQKNPNVVVNYNFLDLQNPENRKTNFSQTLKLPFSNANNQFFENWFDVNLDTLVYNTKTKFDALLYVDSIPQLKGFIELKAIYLNARLYEVALFGDTANFFTEIKDKKLKDAFKTELADTPGEFEIDKQLDHNLTLQNIKNSWTTGITTTEETPTTTNDIMYPIIDWGHTINPYSSAMFWSPGDLWEMNEDGGDTSQVLDTYGFVQASHLKPAIRIQRLLHIIAQKAGYQIKSTFLGIDDTNDSTPITDTQWFSRLFMTLSTETERVQTLHNTSTGSEGPFIGFEVESNASYNMDIPIQAYDTALEWGLVDTMFDSYRVQNEIFDPNNLYNDQLLDWGVEGVSGFPWTPSIRIPDSNSDNALLPSGSFYILINLTITVNTVSTEGEDIDGINMLYQVWDQSTDTVVWSMGFYLTTGTPANQLQFIVPIEATPGTIYYFTINSEPTSSSLFGTPTDYVNMTLVSSSIRTLYTGDVGLMGGGLNGEVQMFHNMPDITQSDFIKDLINRFNLIVNTDPDNEKLLIMEPYIDYVSAGETKYWTDKLDVSKEQVIKSTNKLQYKHLKFSDLEDKDILNQRYTKAHNVVYGEYNEFRQNDFAGKEFKNFSVMSPFIAQGVGEWGINGIQGGYNNGDIAVAYCFEAAEGEERKPIEGMKPKLFYYSGTPVDVSGVNPHTGTAFNFNILSSQYLEVQTDSISTDNKFPLCLQYNLDSLGDVSTTTKILNWTYYTPNFNSGFTFNFFGNVYSTHGYYNDYWAQYINEIYSEEARIMECYLNLTPDDIMTFSGTGFQDTYYIKNTLWRIINISNYLVGGNKSTKVTLLKVIDKLTYECGAIPTVTTTGQITFTDSATGASTTITNACCEDVNDNWTFVQTNATTGVGTCWTDEGGVLTFSEPNQLPMPSLMPNIETNFNIQSTMGDGNNTTFYLQAITADSSTANNFTYSGVQNDILLLPPLSMSYVKVHLIGSIVSGTNSGKCGYLEYDTLLVNRNQFSSHIGTAGGTLLKTNKDTAFTTPTVSLTNFDSRRGFWKPTITGGANEQVSWIAKVEIIQQPLGDPGGVMIPASKALYQNSAGILFQDLNNLEWN
tara:strand:- start:1236 stop:4565 length:3330 start_codon:yes stop_codon:yes gene_type:complete